VLWRGHWAAAPTLSPSLPAPKPGGHGEPTPRNISGPPKPQPERSKAMRQPSLPETLFIDRIDSPIGAMIVVHDAGERLRSLEFEDHEPRMRQLLRHHYGDEGRGYTLKERPAPDAIRQAFARYFAGELGVLDDIPVATAGTPFQRNVWAALREIRPGTTMSYGSLARKLGCPNSVRAVGHANGANPISIVVPCHRVIGSDASLTGYGGGIERKLWLLSHEGATLSRTG
jgi:methylated-DNA-[protein]-cysteine S-methyltransferase